MCFKKSKWCLITGDSFTLSISMQVLKCVTGEFLGTKGITEPENPFDALYLTLRTGVQVDWSGPNASPSLCYINYLTTPVAN